MLTFDPDRLAHLLDKRDQLLALTNTEAKLTHGATGAA
jgi:beta-N-acetylhexosaminidase